MACWVKGRSVRFKRRLDTDEALGCARPAFHWSTAPGHPETLTLSHRRLVSVHLHYFSGSPQSKLLLNV